jgi:hypothetical protein
MTGSYIVPWECGDCSQPESPELKVQWVCHHCGKLLCASHRHDVWDPAFGAGTSRIGFAVHCQACRDTYHPGPLRRWVLSS